MLLSVCPKLPMVNKAATLAFYVEKLGFTLLADHGNYLILKKEGVELHFFAMPQLDPLKSDFMAYVRVDEIEGLNTQCLQSGAQFSTGGRLETKPWGMREFSLIDPSGTCLTFGMPVPRIEAQQPAIK